MKKKLLIYFVLVLIFILNVPCIAEANITEEMINEELNNIEGDSIELYWNDLMNEYGGFFPENQKNLSELILPDNSFDITTFLKGLLRYLFYEILYNSKLLGTIIILTIFSVLLQHIQSAFERSTVSKVGFYISYLVLIIIAINSFTVAIDLAQNAIQDMINFMLAIIPLILTLLAASGGIVSTALFHPLIIFLINVIGIVIKNIIFPLIFFSCLLSIVSSISDKYKVSQLAKLLKNISLGLLGIVLTIFLGVVSVEGVSASVADGVTVRTAKYLTSNFIPVLGKMFSDATDTVMGASLVVKNSIGLAGVIILLVIVIFPALKILAIAFIYHLSAAIMQPLGDNPIIDTLTMIGKNLMIVFTALAAVSLMFYLAITIIISASNISVMVQ